MDHSTPNYFFRHCLPMTFTMDDNEWVNSEKEACSASFSYWAATGKSTGWNWPLGWKRSNEENWHLPISFLGLFYPTLKKKLKSETMILGGGPCSQSVRLTSFYFLLVSYTFRDQRKPLLYYPSTIFIVSLLKTRHVRTFSRPPECGEQLGSTFDLAPPTDGGLWGTLFGGILG